jgi:hypothetical protein
MVEKTAAPRNVKHQAHHIGGGAVRFDTVQHGDGGAQGGDLRQRQVDEDHAALHYVNSQVGVNARQNEARHKGREQKSKHPHNRSLFQLLEQVHQYVEIVIK